MTLRLKSCRPYVLLTSLLVASVVALPVPGSETGLSEVVDNNNGGHPVSTSHSISPNHNLDNSYATSLPSIHADSNTLASSAVSWILRYQNLVLFDSNSLPHSPSIETKRPSTPFLRRADNSSAPIDNTGQSHGIPLYVKLILILGSVTGGVILILVCLWLILYFSTREKQSRRSKVPSEAPFIPPLNTYRHLDSDDHDDDAFPVHSRRSYTDTSPGIIGKGKMREDSPLFSESDYRDPFLGEDIGRGKSSTDFLKNPFEDEYSAKRNEEIELYAYNPHRPS